MTTGDSRHDQEPVSAGAIDAEPMNALLAEAGTAGPTPQGEPAEAELPPFAEQVSQQLGGVRGLLESSIPVTVFVIANIVGTLRPALIISVASAVVIAGFRLTRREPVRHAVNGLFGIALGVLIAWRTGEARDFYLPGIFISLGYAVAMVASVPLRHPVVGWIWSVVFAGGGNQWRDNPRLLRAFNWLTMLWAGIYLVKVVVQWALWAAHQPDLLGVVRLALGYPPYLLLLALTLWAVRKAAPESSG